MPKRSSAEDRNRTPSRTPDRHHRPLPRSAEVFTLPAISRVSCANGLDIRIVERHDLAMVTSSIVLQAGSIEEPSTLPGLSAMVAELLDAGTSSKNALEISSALEGLGTSLKGRAGYDGASVAVSFLARHAGPSVGILAELLSDAVFPATELERARRQRLAAILQQMDRPSSIATLALYRLLYGPSHPYGNDAGGTEDSVKRLTQVDVVDFFDRRYRPAGASMILVGPVHPGEIETFLAPILDHWKGDKMDGERKPVGPPCNPEKVLIHRPGAAQSEIRIGSIGLPRNSPDFFPVLIMNRILGGQFSSRMNANLRERRGFTYGAFTSFSFGKLAGPFVSGAAVHTVNTGEAVSEMAKEIEKMRTDGITADELSFAKEGIEGSFALAFESPSQVISIVQNLILYDLPDDYYSRYLDNVRAVTLEDVRKVAARYLDPATMSAVVVGDSEKVRTQLTAAGLGEFRERRAEDMQL